MGDVCVFMEENKMYNAKLSFVQCRFSLTSMLGIIGNCESAFDILAYTLLWSACLQKQMGGKLESGTELVSS